MDYTFAIGTDDPRALSAPSDPDAVAMAVQAIRTHHWDDLRQRPQAVVTLMGAGGLVTRPSERLDEFVERVLPANPAAPADTLQPGDLNSPDCNAD